MLTALIVTNQICKLMKKTCIYCALILVTASAFFTYRYIKDSTYKPLDLTLKVDFGKDLGQSVGTLLTIKDKSLTPVIGVGFPDTYSTSIRHNNRLLTLYYKGNWFPVYTKKRLAKPFPDKAGVRTLNLGNKLWAFPEISRTTYRELDVVTDEWLAPQATETQFMGIQYVNNLPLVFADRQVLYNGKNLIPNLEQDTIKEFYYVDGKLFIFVRSENSQLYVCTWDSYVSDQIDITRCESFGLHGYHAAVFAFGNLDGDVIMALNTGNIFRYRNGELSYLFENTEKLSNQMYSSVVYYDNLFFGHYPTGNLHVYDGETLHNFDSATFPGAPEVPKRGNELQSLALYGGDLYAGLWPFGRLWKYNYHSNSWSLVDRFFTAPPVFSGRVGFEPYADDVLARDLAIENNAWGQRILSLTPFMDSLYVSTCNKRGEYLNAAEDQFIESEVLEEYGLVWQIKNGYNMTCPFEWPQEELELTISVKEDALEVYSGVTLLCSLPIDSAHTLSKPELGEVVVGKGSFGDFNGESISLVD